MENKFKYYKLNGNYIFSLHEYGELNRIDEEEIRDYGGYIYYLNKLPVAESRGSFSLSHPSLLHISEEGLELLTLQGEMSDFSGPSWILDKIEDRKVKSINSNYPNWMEEVNIRKKDGWKVNILALGDVGSTLAIGLRLMGGEDISEIGIYDRNINRLNRWEYELNQVREAFADTPPPPVKSIGEDDLFNCHMFVFCASKGIPPLDSKTSDVRMAQYEANSSIISQYAKMARDRRFKGIFAVVSDPVDLLSKVALLESNKNDLGDYDYRGLLPEQVIGYGLGVMNSRACFYAEKSPDTLSYLEEGRVFGPHGDGLIVANSIVDYDQELSDYLTEKTINANKEIREFGYKPFIAPALSSGALSILATIRGDWFYGSTYMGRVYMGARCRLLESGLELEQLDLPEELAEKIKMTYDRLAMII
ncbi:MAG: lactate dehydrogenase [Tissierellaceae bacterium]